MAVFATRGRGAEANAVLRIIMETEYLGGVVVDGFLKNVLQAGYAGI